MTAAPKARRRPVICRTLAGWLIATPERPIGPYRWRWQARLAAWWVSR